MRKIIEPCGLHCIRMNGISVTIGQDRILSDINLHIHCGTLAAIIGKNGAGKSTLLRAILGDIPHDGTIEFRDREDGKVQKLRIGYVPQSLNIEKKTPLSVYDMLACYQSRYPVFLPVNKKLHAKIREHLAIFQAEELIDRQVCNLSGGEMQRVLLSLAVMDEPNLLLLDEPVSGIDAAGMELFYRTIADLKNNYDLAVILISHDLDYVAEYADQVILLDGRVLKQGTVRQVYDSEEFRKVFGTQGARILPSGRNGVPAAGENISACSVPNLSAGGNAVSSAGERVSAGSVLNLPAGGKSLPAAGEKGSRKIPGDFEWKPGKGAD